MEARKPSALKGWARVLVTAWVLIIVPILLGWRSAHPAVPQARGVGVGERLAARHGACPTRTPRRGDLDRPPGRARAAGGGRGADHAADGHLGGQEGVGLERGGGRAGRSWSPGRRGWRALLTWAGGRPASTTPCAPTDRGTLVSAVQTVSAPAAAARPAGVAAPPRLSAGPPSLGGADPARRPDQGAPGAVRRQGATTATSRRSSSAPRRPTPAGHPRSTSPARPAAAAPSATPSAMPRPRRPRRRPSSRSRCRTRPGRATRRRSPPTPRTGASSTTSPTRS